MVNHARSGRTYGYFCETGDGVDGLNKILAMSVRMTIAEFWDCLSAKQRKSLLCVHKVIIKIKQANEKACHILSNDANSKI